MNIYLAELHRPKNGNCSNGFIVRWHIEAENRGQAVHKAQLWYWAKYRGSLGPAHKVLVVSDPYGEVCYGPHFNCGIKTNLLLPADVIARLLIEAHGELVADDRPWRKHHPPGSVRRVKRRRDFGRFVIPHIRQMANGRLYYRVTLVSQRTKNDRRYRKRKYRDIPLTAQVPLEAVEEVRSRGLPAMHRSVSRRIVRSRSLAILRKKALRLFEANAISAS